MKNILDSSEIFEAHARHDYWLFILNNLQKGMQDRKPQSGLGNAIDVASGYKDSMELTDLMNVFECLEGIMSEKKIIEAPLEDTEEAIMQVAVLIKPYTDRGIKCIESKRLKWED